MAHLHCDFFSDILGQSTAAEILLPEYSEVCVSVPSSNIQPPFPVLYLLHGYNGNETVWQRYTSLERYAGEYPFAIIMPRANHSYYVNSETTGYDYFRFLTEELPQKMKHFFNISTRRDQTVIAGLSMGGFGAMNCALKRPDLYCAAASLSGMIDPATRYTDGSVREHCRRSLGDTCEIMRARGNDLIGLLKSKNAQEEQIPSLYIACGREDFLFSHSVNFHAVCQSKGISCSYKENSGIHDWTYWDKELPDLLSWASRQITL